MLLYGVWLPPDNNPWRGVQPGPWKVMRPRSMPRLGFAPPVTATRADCALGRRRGEAHLGLPPLAGRPHFASRLAWNGRDQGAEVPPQFLRSSPIFRLEQTCRFAVSGLRACCSSAPAPAVTSGLLPDGGISSMCVQHTPTLGVACRCILARCHYGKKYPWTPRPGHLLRSEVHLVDQASLDKDLGERICTCILFERLSAGTDLF